MEQVCAYCNWETDDFVEMNFRLFDKQENNYEFWDNAERDVLENYLARCRQLEKALHEFPIDGSMKHNFYLNWQNVITAWNFIEELRNTYEPLPLPLASHELVVDHTVEKCNGTWEEQPRYWDERPIKEALAKGKAIYQWGSGMHYLDKLLPALEFVSRDFRDCAWFQSGEKVSMTVSEFFKRRQERTLSALLLGDLKKSSRLELLPDNSISFTFKSTN